MMRNVMYSVQAVFSLKCKRILLFQSEDKFSLGFLDIRCLKNFFSGSLSFNKVTMIDIKQNVYNAISKRRDRVNSEGIVK